MDIASELNTIKKSIETAERDKARLEGSRDASMKTLKDTFDIASLEEAKAVVVKLEKEIAVSKLRLEKQLKAINDEFFNG